MEKVKNLTCPHCESPKVHDFDGKCLLLTSQNFQAVIEYLCINCEKMFEVEICANYELQEAEVLAIGVTVDFEDTFDLELADDTEDEDETIENDSFAIS